MAENKNVYKIRIEISDNQLWADVIVCLHQPNLFQKLWAIRQKYIELLDENFPISGDILESRKIATANLRDADKYYPLKKQIRRLRKEFMIPYIFERMLFWVVATGTIIDEDYTRASYRYIPEGDVWSDEVKPGIHSIILHPAAREEDVLRAFNEFQKINRLNTKSAKNRSAVSPESETQTNEDVDGYYHRLLSFVDDNPKSINDKDSYKLYCEYKLSDSYIPPTLTELKKEPAYAWSSLAKFEEMKKMAKLDAYSTEKEKAEDFMNRYHTVNDEVKTRIKRMGRLIKNSQNIFFSKALSDK